MSKTKKFCQEVLKKENHINIIEHNFCLLSLLPFTSCKSFLPSCSSPHWSSLNALSNILHIYLDSLYATNTTIVIRNKDQAYSLSVYATKENIHIQLRKGKSAPTNSYALRCPPPTPKHPHVNHRTKRFCTIPNTLKA